MTKISEHKDCLVYVENNKTDFLTDLKTELQWYGLIPVFVVNEPAPNYYEIKLCVKENYCYGPVQASAKHVWNYKKEVDDNFNGLVVKTDAYPHINDAFRTLAFRTNLRLEKFSIHLSENFSKEDIALLFPNYKTCW